MRWAKALSEEGEIVAVAIIVDICLPVPFYHGVYGTDSVAAGNPVVFASGLQQLMDYGLWRESFYFFLAL